MAAFWKANQSRYDNNLLLRENVASLQLLDLYCE
jgi:hypothetical protein